MAVEFATPAHARQAQRAAVQKFITRVFVYAILFIFGIMFAFPFFWTLSTSLKTGIETRVFPPELLPEIPQFQNYLQVWTSQPLMRWILNSAIIIGLAVPGTIISSILVAYSFARFRYPGQGVLFILLLSMLMLPFEVTLIPQYLMFHRLGWINTYLPLTVPAWFGTSAFSIFLLRQFIMTLPRDLDEAAHVDGANSLQILWHILIPLCGPVIATIAILNFLGHWNDFFGPFIYLNSESLFTMAIGLRYFQTIPDSTEGPKEHLLMAASIVSSLPAIILFFTAQRYFVRGIVTTGLKL